jgi:hypothetical protein
MPKTRCDLVYLGHFDLFFPVGEQNRKLPRPYPPPTVTIKLASDWLGVVLELRSFYYWSSTKIGNQRIDEWLLSKHGRVQSAPLMSSESSLISLILFVYRGLIRPLALG